MQILRILSQRITLAPDFDLERAARVTPGFSGADLANVINEAALLSTRRNASGVSTGTRFREVLAQSTPVAAESASTTAVPVLTTSPGPPVTSVP